MSQRLIRAFWIPIAVLCLMVGPNVWAADPERPARVPDMVSDPPPDRSDIRAHIQRIFNTPHAVLGDERTPFAKEMCVTCHGPGMEVFFNLDDHTPERLNQPCLACHEEGARRHWQGSVHEGAGLACVNCHAIHNERKRLLKADTQLEVCSDCHLERRSDFLKPSRHPVAEGLMTCTDCHNPHGTAGPRKLVQSTINETCYNCHAEKRGPFLWEHNPAREDCVTCHDPHGSIHRPLLHARPPQLCQQCHLGSHSSLALTGTDFRIQGQSCLNCHSQVHGTNHPRGYQLNDR